MENQEILLDEMTSKNVNTQNFKKLSFDGVNKSKALEIKSTFKPMAKMLEDFESDFQSVIQEAEKEITSNVTKKAKRLRLDIAKVRIETEKTRKSQKQEVLRLGKAIDGVSNILKYAVTDKEQTLKGIEDYFAIQEKKRLDKIQNERAKRLSEFVDDAYERDLLKFEDDEFEAFLLFKKKEKAEKEKAEAEAERIRQIEKEKENTYHKRIFDTRIFGNYFDVENLTLDTTQQEYDEMCIKAKSLLEKAEKEKEKIRKENERLVQKQKEAELERKKMEAKIKAEKEKLAEIKRKEKEKEEKEKAEAEAERIRQIEKEKAEIQSELNKSDELKVNDLLSELEAISLKYKFKSDMNKAMYKKVSTSIVSLMDYIRKNTK